MFQTSRLELAQHAIDGLSVGEMKRIAKPRPMLLLLQRGGESAEVELAGASPTLFQPRRIEVLRRILLMLPSTHRKRDY
jgi:hypothetical protein